MHDVQVSSWSSFWAEPTAADLGCIELGEPPDEACSGMIEGRDAGRALTAVSREAKPCHSVGELQSAFVPIALIFVPA